MQPVPARRQEGCDGDGTRVPSPPTLASPTCVVGYTAREARLQLAADHEVADVYVELMAEADTGDAVNI